MIQKTPVMTKILVLTKDELVEALSDFYTPILQDTAADIIAGGQDNLPIPEMVFDKGLLGLDLEELAEVASVWVDVLFDEQSTENGGLEVVLLQERGVNLVLGTLVDAREKQSEASEGFDEED